jgi:hypothetical protein
MGELIEDFVGLREVVKHIRTFGSEEERSEMKRARRSGPLLVGLSVWAYSV